MNVRKLCLLLAGLAVVGGGCARYHVGTQSLYPADIHTVYVPMFHSTSYRRGLGELLTEAVIKEIEKRTTFKVVNTPAADSILTGQLIGDEKRVTIENSNDDPREVRYDFTVEVSWQNRKGDLIMQENIPLPPEIVSVWGYSKIVPEVGQSTTTAEVQSIHRLAGQIVDLMEVPWGIETRPLFLPQ